jgi:ribosome biogenesis GTPase
MIKGKIFRSSKRVFDCKINGEKELISATALREVIKKAHPVVGDNVSLKQAEDSSDWEISEILPRENEVFRRIVRTNQKKVIAANTDVILIVTSVSQPTYKPFLIDRYLTRAVQWDIPAAIVFNKMDQFDNSFELDFELEKFKSLGVTTFQLNSANPEDPKFKEDFDKLKYLLENKTAICLGQSGVGKSKLITALSGGTIELLSSRLAKKANKGAHTTTWAELVDCQKFLMVDSPGVRSLSVQDISIDELPMLFPDLRPLFAKCKFRDCKHEDNSKGCFFHSLDEEIPADKISLNRKYSYLRLKEEIEEIPEWQKAK